MYKNITKVKEFLKYDSVTGNIYSILDTRNKKAGESLGYYKNGYIIISFMGNNYPAHRLAWLLHYGTLLKPEEQIDHINHVRSDNTLKNLRIADYKINGKNRSHAKNNTSGVTGVHWSYNKWRAQIKVDGTIIDLGTFVKFTDAVNARKNAEVLYGFHDNHGA